MKAKDYLKFIAQEIHTTVAATTDMDHLPVTCAIDIMDFDDNSLYFLTAKGKGFYDRLKMRGYLSLTGMKGENTMSCVAVTLRGKVRELGIQKRTELFDKNPYMYEIYPDEDSQGAIRVFQMYEGTGEWFDLSKKPVERANFSFGGAVEAAEGYVVTDRCIGCKLCYSRCPQKCIEIRTNPVTIHQNNCLHCGNCFEICPVNAIVRKEIL